MSTWRYPTVAAHGSWVERLCDTGHHESNFRLEVALFRSRCRMSGVTKAWLCDNEILDSGDLNVVVCGGEVSARTSKINQHSQPSKDSTLRRAILGVPKL